MPHGFDQLLRPFGELRRDSNFPVLRSAFQSLGQGREPLVANRLRLVELRQFPELQLDDLLRAAEEAAAVAGAVDPRGDRILGMFPICTLAPLRTLVRSPAATFTTSPPSIPPPDSCCPGGSRSHIRCHRTD